ncbi:MAG: IgGFc-binding protein [Tannerellaceae bacterium]|jgi:hypothetical protein|nr:IgGFc-binding protein [Tannerellaceae bacterium]
MMTDMMYKLCIFFIGFSALLFTLPSRAQDTDFWFVAPHMSEQLAAGVPLNRPAFLAISNTTGQDAHVTVSRYNGANASINNVVTIAPGNLYKLDFTTDADMKTIENPRGQAGNITEFGIHITSDVKVTAYYMHNHTDSRDFFTLKGRQALGTQFYVPMQSDNAASTGSYTGACDQIDIVATEDNTEVTIVPKTAVRIGSSGSSAANVAVTRTLNRGQTLKIMEHTVNSNPTLAGTSITSSKPVAVTVTEDLVGGDTSGDQIVPVNSLGTRYIVPRGYLGASSTYERFYLVGTEAATTVRIYTTGTTPATTLTLNAGATQRYSIPANVYAVYVESEKPVYIYQRTGYGEEGAAVLPSIYGIGQKQMTYYQVQGHYEQGFLVFRSGMQSGFRISYGTVNTLMTSLSGFTVYSIPSQPDWQIARFNLPAAANNQVVTIRNPQSPFSFGYIAANLSTNNMGCYGYFSAFGFELPDTTYMCTSATTVTLEGGYAKSYNWTFPDARTFQTQDVTADMEGEYTLVMDQDPTIVTVTTFVRMIHAGAICSGRTICFGTTPGELSVSGASGDTYQWQISSDNVTWTDIAGATSPVYTPGILHKTTWYRRGITANQCAMTYSGSAKIEISPCVVPINPHLRSRVIGQ